MISFKTQKFITQYDNNISFENFNKTVDYLTTRSDLSNVEVKIYYFKKAKSNKHTRKETYRILAKIFFSLGAVLTEVESVNSMIKKENIELAKKNEFNSKADRWLFILIFFLGVVGIFYLKTHLITQISLLLLVSLYF